MSNLAVRLISAALMVFVIYGALVPNLVSRWAIIALILALGAWEFARMLEAKLPGPKAAWFAGLLAFAFYIPQYPGFSALCPNLAAAPALWPWGLSILAVLSFTLLGFRYCAIENMAPWIYLHLFGVAYFGVYSSAFFGLMEPETGWRGIFPLLLVQVAVASADSGAYFTGRKFGKRKLAPTISSGKTLEGAIGGVALTVIMVMLLGPRLLGTGAPANLGLGLLMSLTAVVGDLFISILKRYTGVKDSSHLIPGHGGILDRFDALIFSAPVAVYYLKLVHF